MHSGRDQARMTNIFSKIITRKIQGNKFRNIVPNSLKKSNNKTNRMYVRIDNMETKEVTTNLGIR